MDTVLSTKKDDFSLNATVTVLQLNALQDDFSLNAIGDIERSDGVEIIDEFFLVDSLGNFMVDSLGNFMVAYDFVTVFPQNLHALSDDFSLNAE